MDTIEELEIGDHVRSFDFPETKLDLEGERACYIEGYIRGIQWYDGCDRYKIQITKRVWGGVAEYIDEEKYVLPPVNGTLKLFGGYTDGVYKIE